MGFPTRATVPDFIDGSRSSSSRSERSPIFRKSRSNDLRKPESVKANILLVSHYKDIVKISVICGLRDVRSSRDFSKLSALRHPLHRHNTSDSRSTDHVRPVPQTLSRRIYSPGDFAYVVNPLISNKKIIEIFLFYVLSIASAALTLDMERSTTCSRIEIY